MRKTTTTIQVLTLATAAAAAAAAAPAAVQAQQPAATEAVAITSEWRVPIHGGEADPMFCDYGIWAVGATYKVSFHDGFAFYPYLGPSYEHNLPVVWHTESISVGEAPLVDAASPPVRHHTDWRYEYRYGPVTEAYDVLPEGVEQTFVLHRPPAGSGDLVVKGRIDTPLSASARAAEHAPLTYRDDGGKAIVEYGEAVAIDAAGRRAAVTTSFDGGRVELRLSGAWLRQASYPVVVDPLTAAATLYQLSPSSPPNVVPDSDVFCSVSGGARPNLIVHSREFSGTDRDAYGFVSTDDFTTRNKIWSDATASWSTIRPRCTEAWNAAAPRWVIAFQRTAGSTSVVHVYTQREDSLTLNVGIARMVGSGSNLEEYRPDVGGSGQSTWPVVVVFEQQSTRGGTSDVLGVRFDPGSGTLGAPFRLSVDTTHVEDRKNPSITKFAKEIPVARWVVAWQEKDAGLATDDSDLVVNRVHGDGAIDVDAEVGPASSTIVDAYSPILAGDLSRYVIVYSWSNPVTLQRGTGHQRFDWPATTSKPTLGKIWSRSHVLSLRVPQGAAFDWVTQSHWAVAYRSGTSMELQRLGFTGGVVESGTIPGTGNGLGAGAVAFSHREVSYLTTYASQTSRSPLFGRYFLYGAAGAVLYGTQCGDYQMSLPGVHRYLPHAGYGLFAVSAGCTASTCRPLPLFLVAAAGAGVQTLPFGGCQLLVDPATMFVVGVTTTVSQYQQTIAVPIPDDPAFLGDLHCQFLYIDGRLIRTTRGMILKVR